jgi:ubiquinone/menaquinone biosynthesis C-methylase UbiE
MELDAKKQEDMLLHDTKIAKKYESVRETNKFSKQYQENWIKEILRSVPGTPSNVLDYCCGTSSLYPFVAKELPESKYFGIDLSKEMLKIGKKRFGAKVSLDQQDGENLTYKNKFDAVVARGAFHHLPNPDKGLQSIAKALKPNGVLVLSEPTSNFLIKAFRKVMYKVLSHFPSGHISFTPSELKKLVEENGFVIEKTKRWGLLAFPFGFPDIIPILGYFPYWFLKFLEEFDKILLKVPIINTFSWHLIIVARKKP